MRKRLIDATAIERRDRIHAICAACSTDAERMRLYWQFVCAEVAELNEQGARHGLPAIAEPPEPAA